MNNVDMADICELAHALTVTECKRRKIPVGTGEEYTQRAQKVFDKYYNLITNILNI